EMREQLLLERGGQRRVVHHRHFEHLEESGLRDIAPLRDGRSSVTEEEAWPDVWPEPLADERLVRVIGSETRDQVDLVAESSQVVRAGEDSSRLTLELHVPRGDDGILGSRAQRHAMVVLVDDRFAYHEDFERPERGQRVTHRA